MPIKFQGKVYPAVSPDDLSPGEVDALERAVGMTFQKIRRLGELCVCEHGKKDHEHKDAAGAQTDDTSCTRCSVCERHEPDLPMRVQTGMLWLGIRKLSPHVTFDEVSATPMADLFVDEPAQDAPPDPTDPPPPGEAVVPA